MKVGSRLLLRWFPTWFSFDPEEGDDELLRKVG
jgi:hypothetical protein